MTNQRKASVRQVAISVFKAKCLALVEEVNKTKAPLRITRRGRAIADVVPIAPPGQNSDWLGSMSDRLTLVGDVIAPVIETRDIEALRD